MLKPFERWRKICADEAFEGFEFGMPVTDFNGWESNTGTNEWSRIVFLQNQGHNADSAKYRFKVLFDEHGVMACEMSVED